VIESLILGIVAGVAYIMGHRHAMRERRDHESRAVRLLLPGVADRRIAARLDARPTPIAMPIPGDGVSRRG
jgi:hypothetical protein